MPLGRPRGTWVNNIKMDLREVGWDRSEMANHTMVSADVTPVFVNNSSERSEVTCACCDKVRRELQKILIELKSARKIIELL
jgi:hypothetical protein